MTAHGQPSRHRRWEALKKSFQESNYITDFWNWFMTLMSKAAEMVLFGTVLYSGYQLLPGVPHVPAGIDAAVFVIQQGALDIGGMGLLKLARRAGLPKESFPVRLGVSLVVLMILNVALASIKHTLPMLPDGVFVGIETGLLIARAIVAVLFGHAIHALREEYGESTITLKEASELEQCVEALSAELAHVQEDMQQRIEQQVSLLDAQQAMMLTTVKQDVQTTLASLTPERLIASLSSHLETLLEKRLSVLSAETRQSTTPEPRETGNLRFLTPQKVSHHATRPESVPAGEGSHLARIYALLNQDRSRKPAEIQRLTGIPKATVYRLVERYHREHPVIEASTSSETKQNEETSSDETETAS